MVKDTQLSERTVQSALRLLEQAGYIIAEQGGGRNRTSRYRLPLYEAVLTLNGAGAAPFSDDETGQQLHPLPQETGQDVHPLIRERVQSTTLNGAGAAPKLPVTSKVAAKPAVASEFERQTAGVMPRLSDPKSAWTWLADKRPDGMPDVCTGEYPEQLIQSYAARGKILPPYPEAEIGCACVANRLLRECAVAVCEAAGIHDRDHRYDWQPLIGWLRDGIDIADIEAAIKRVAARSSYEPPKSLRYFDAAVREPPRTRGRR